MIKKIVLLAVVLISFTLTMEAQNKDERRYIDVTGSAELKVVPDEIFLSIKLNEADLKDRRSLDEMERDVVSVLNKLNIPTENLSISGADSKLEKAFWTGKKIYAQKDYVLKITKAETIGPLLKELEKKKISNVQISHVDNSEMQKYRKEVKIKAMKAAKEKADYLLEAIGERTGKPIMIQERNYHPPTYRATANYMSKEEAIGGQNYTLEFEEMKLRYEIFARFEIVE